MRFLLTLLCLIIFPFAIQAGEKAPIKDVPPAEAFEETKAKDEDETLAENSYSPDFCEFKIDFPERPYSTRRCDGDKKDRCYDLVSYTQVYELSATVNFRVICNPINESVYDDYSTEVMQATLRAMTKGTVVDEYNSAFREEDGYKQAGLVGAGKVGRMPMIYIAQLWIGKQSAFSVEAELIGEANGTADDLFSDILKTVKYSGIKATQIPIKTVPPRD